MELLWLQPVLLALLSTNTKIEPSKSGVADIEGREVCDSQTLTQSLPSDGLPSHTIALTLGNSRISKTL